MPSRPRKSREQLVAENKMLRRAERADTVAKVVRIVVPWASVALIAYFARDVLLAYAGETTLANLTFNFLFKAEVGRYLAYVFGGGGVAYGLSQRKLRRDTVQRLQTRITQLEQQRDARRTSSRLTTRGETNPSDDP